MSLPCTASASGNTKDAFTIERTEAAQEGALRTPCRPQAEVLLGPLRTAVVPPAFVIMPHSTLSLTDFTLG
ncbi:MAG: hypothetical protein K0U36_05690 [Alphaproteobacteria bacterium]|nr:hypothetical protein [Alphaproteobacteria bacterium]